ncbi:MAG: DegT/DnrJ/EryC1/StrS family aminotransferase [Bacteroidota bacterium]|nr:DegT/DnrJ/EryC1/StrS family aminotransferase [Bacteroidota bacterium]
MVDLKSQYEKIKSEVDAGIQEVIDNTAFIKGPQVKKFETELTAYLNVKHVIACANGTDALQIAMMALELKPGDEVILPAFTYVATAEVIALLGLKPVMVDVEPETFCINVQLIESKITPKTKAIVPVHLFGQCANMDAILTIASKHRLFVIEDTAQALGSVYTFGDRSKKSAGCMGTIGTTSFFPSKNLGCYGDGGALMTNDDELAKKLRMVANHGQAIQYKHDCIGVNSRLDTLQAAILLAKLPHLDAYAAARHQAANIYDQLLGNHPKIKIPARNPQSTHVFHQYTMQLTGVDRDTVRKALADKGIPSMVYYPIPLHQQKAFYNPDYTDADFPVTVELCKSVLSLPIHTEMDEEMIQFISNNLLELVS